MSRRRRRTTGQPTTVDSDLTMVSGGNLAGYDVTYSPPPAPRKLSTAQRFMTQLYAERGMFGGG